MAVRRMTLPWPPVRAGQKCGGRKCPASRGCCARAKRKWRSKRSINQNVEEHITTSDAASPVKSVPLTTLDLSRRQTSSISPPWLLPIPPQAPQYTPHPPHTLYSSPPT